MPGCLGVNLGGCRPHPNPGIPTAKKCSPGCEIRGYKQVGPKTLRCVGESIGYKPPTAVGDLIWDEEAPQYIKQSAYRDSVCHTPETDYGANDHMGFTFGPTNSQVQGWGTQVLDNSGRKAWRITKSDPVGADGLDSGVSQDNALRKEECFRLCDWLNDLVPPDGSAPNPRKCIGVNVAEGLYCYPIASRDYCPNGQTSYVSDIKAKEYAPMLYQGAIKVHPGFETYYRQLESGGVYQTGLERKTTPQCEALVCKDIHGRTGSNTWIHTAFMAHFDAVQHNIEDCLVKNQATEICEVTCMPGYTRTGSEATTKATFKCRSYDYFFEPHWDPGRDSKFPKCDPILCGSDPNHHGRPYGLRINMSSRAWAQRGGPPF